VVLPDPEGAEKMINFPLCMCKYNKQSPLPGKVGKKSLLSRGRASHKKTSTVLFFTVILQFE